MASYLTSNISGQIMKLFQNLFKPKWKNTDPAVRKQAILALEASDNQETLIDVVAQDKNTDIRLLALKRLKHINDITHAAQANDNTDVKTLANKLVRQLLSGEHPSPLTEKERIEKIQKINEQSLFEHIVENATSVSLRSSVIEHITREGLLGNLAITDNDANIRSIAAKKISQKSTLERVYKATKTKDKSISRIIKTRLDQLIAETEKPAKLLATQKRLCESMEKLGNKGLWQQEKNQYDTLFNQWNALKETDTLSLEKRFSIASNKFTQGYETYLKRNDEKLKQEAAYLPIKAEKQAIIDQLKKHASHLSQNPSINESDINNIQTLTNEHLSNWQAIKALPDDIENEIRGQFNDLVKVIKTHINSHQSNKALSNSLDKLHKEINYYLSHPFKLSSSTLATLENKLSKLKPDQDDTLLTTLSNEIKQKISDADKIFSKQADRMESLSKDLFKKISTMEDKLEKGILKEAISLRKTIQDNLIELEKNGIENIQELKEKFQASSGKINELNNWRSWANTPQKETLIKKIEALINSELDPKEIAYIVSQARKEWKNLGPSEKNSSQTLWEQFQAACDKAYEPCKTYFAEESKILEENHKQRLVFLDTLDTFLNQADWDNIDWKKVETVFRHARQDWNALGLTDRNKRKDLNKKFYALHNQLKDALNKEWDKNTLTKTEIVNEAVSLAQEEDLQTAINEAKKLQQKWKSAGRIQHAKERELWTQFKTASDNVFLRRDELAKQKTNAEKQSIEMKNGLLETVEAYCNQTLEQLSDSKGTFNQQLKAFKDAPQTTPEKEAVFEKRLVAALDLYERKQESLEKFNLIADLSLLKQKANICINLEKSIEDNSHQDLDAMTAKMDSLKSSKKSEWNEQITQRFQSSLAIARDKDAQIRLVDHAKKNLELKNRMIVQLEIIADVETPDNVSDQRLKAQTQRLSDKLQGGHEEESNWSAFLNSEVSWLISGPVLSDDLISLNHRHDSVIKALKSEYPEELKNY